jgi:hypothetical protein
VRTVHEVAKLDVDAPFGELRDVGGELDQLRIVAVSVIGTVIIVVGIVVSILAA